MESFAENLLWVVNTDSYIRQPCYSVRTRAQYYLIFEHLNSTIYQKLKYIQGEFPEFLLNYLTESEIYLYPEHGRWQFYFFPILYNKKNKPIIEVNREDNIKAIEQALFGIGHIARLYYLRTLDSKTHTWAVRQLGWALRYAEFGIIKLYNYIISSKYEVFFPVEVQEEIEWLIFVNANWVQYENELLSDVSIYQEASLKLNGIVECFSKCLAKDRVEVVGYINDDSNEYDNISFNFIAYFKSDLENEFKDDLMAFYLHGSAARGDQYAGSDIDCIAIFKQLDTVTIMRLKSIISKYDNISVTPLSLNGLINYPDFRFYGLCLGSRKISGHISFQFVNSKAKMIQGMLNNLFTILQVSRAYLLLESYGPRAPYMLKLMMKLSDHGYMRLKIMLETDSFPNKKEAVRQFFKNDTNATLIMEYLLDIPHIDKKISVAVQNGDYEPIKAQYHLLLQFVDVQLKTFSYRKVYLK